MSKTLNGACLCGGVEYEVTDPEGMGVCHCTRCQRWTGSSLTGGTTAGISGGPQEIARVMKGIYDYMLDTGMRYTSDSGVPTKLGDVKTMVAFAVVP